MEYTELIIKIAIGWILMILACSFAWKCVQATVHGKLTYWHGFTPISVISPFLIHSKPREGTLIRSTTGLWVHLFMGPIFLILAVVLMAIGADLAGFAGTDTLNLIIGGGNPTAPPVILYNKSYGFSFPIIARMGQRFDKFMNSAIIPLSEKDKLFGVQQAKPDDTIRENK